MEGSEQQETLRETRTHQLIVLRPPLQNWECHHFAASELESKGGEEASGLVWGRGCMVGMES